MYLFLNINDPSVYRDSSKAGNRTENTIYIPISIFDTDAGIQKTYKDKFIANTLDII